jgi:phage shock protein PspC (stress-responsive transcriptional regulator)
MDKFFSALHGIGMRRRTDDKWIAGVCSGLADRLGIDPVIVRAGLVLLTLLGGLGVTTYLIAWVFIPNKKEEIVAQQAFRDRDGSSIVLVIFATLSLFGGSAFAGPLWGGHSGWGFPWGVALTGLLIWWLVQRAGHKHDVEPMDPALQLGTPNMGAEPAPSSAQMAPHTEGRGRGSTLSPGPALMQGQTVPRTHPKRLRRRSGGPLMALLALGLALATYGSVIWAGTRFAWNGDHQTIALAGALATIGLLLTVLGVAGWRGGFVTFLAIILAVATATSAAVPTGIHVNQGIGDASWAPTSVSAGTDYQLGVGNGVLDLSNLALEGPIATIPASVGIGELKIVVPPGLKVEVVGHVSLGEILAPNGTGGSGADGSDVHRSVLIGSGPTDVVVNAEVGIGQLTLVRE